MSRRISFLLWMCGLGAVGAMTWLDFQWHAWWPFALGCIALPFGAWGAYTEARDL